MKKYLIKLSKKLTRINKQKLLLLVVPVIFFVVALTTIYDYGMNWDSPVHFARGHSFLHYFLTRNKDYSDLPIYCQGQDDYNASVDFETGEVCDRHRENKRSEMQSYILDYSFFTGRDPYGHPAFSDIVLALSNQIFFKSLGWIEDVPSHHVYPIVAMFILVLTVAFWGYRVSGLIGGVVASLVVSLFPLLLSEQHFNIKDPIVASFFLLALYLFWMSITEKKARYMYLSAIAGAISFSTKINFIFAPAILLPWGLIYLGIPYYKIWKDKKISVKNIINKFVELVPIRIIIAILVYPFIVFTLFYISWPTLWDEPVKNVTTFFTYYKDIGTSVCQYSSFTPNWLIKCSNPITVLYILTTVPIVSLGLFLIGIIYSPKIWRKANYSIVLWVSFLLITVLRVTLPNTSIYGGLRHVMEFIGPFALIAGVGGCALYKLIGHIINRLSRGEANTNAVKILSIILIVSMFIPITIQMFSMHPNQNVYYNSFIGGLKGARERNFYGYANHYGNVYYQAMKWMDDNAEEGAGLTLLWGLNQNITRSRHRADVTHLGISRSGYSQLGEYQLTTLEYGIPVYGTFRFNYATRFLEPVYSVEVDSVPLFMIWKNDSEHIKKEFNLEDVVEVKPENIIVEDNQMLITLPDTYNLQRIDYTFPEKCYEDFTVVKPSVSADSVNFRQLPDAMNNFTEPERRNFQEVTHKTYTYFFAGDPIKSIHHTIIPTTICDLNTIIPTVYAFENLRLF